ncbi:MAG TPA: hypothetical protein VHB21_04165 [Minicystis sp.]|nr:hypothetical protein [Minicystis sp.]
MDAPAAKSRDGTSVGAAPPVWKSDASLYSPSAYIESKRFVHSTPGS